MSDYPSNAEALKNPGVSRGFEVVRLLTLEMRIAIEALERIATGHIGGERDSASTARVMRGIAAEALEKLPYRKPTPTPTPGGLAEGGRP